MGGALQVLTLDEIVEINRRMILRFGGIFFEADANLANRGSLEHVLVQIQFPLFGQQRFPTALEKAAAICWRIITDHVFHDGNKRTGMEACRLFLELNGYSMRIDQEIVSIALKIATGEIEFEEFVQWLKSRTSEGEQPQETVT